MLKYTNQITEFIDKIEIGEEFTYNSLLEYLGYDLSRDKTDKDYGNMINCVAKHKYYTSGVINKTFNGHSRNNTETKFMKVK